MKQIGAYMAIFGIFAIVLNFFNMVPKILFWIYMWGESIAWMIKIGLVVVGAAIYFITPSNKEEEIETPAEEQ